MTAFLVYTLYLCQCENKHKIGKKNVHKNCPKPLGPPKFIALHGYMYNITGTCTHTVPGPSS